jgi:hypothetical protein
MHLHKLLEKPDGVSSAIDKGKISHAVTCTYHACIVPSPCCNTEMALEKFIHTHTAISQEDNTETSREYE